MDIPLTPGSGGQPPVGGSGAEGTPPGINTEDWSALLQNLKSILPQTEDTASLRALTDQLAEGGFTAYELVQLELEASKLTINCPSLSPGDQAKVLQFLAQVIEARAALRQLELSEKLAAGTPTSGIPTGDPTNSFLSGPMMSKLYMILMEVYSLESLLKFEENILKVSLSQMAIKIAEDIATLVIQLGEVAAKKCEATAAQYEIEGILAITQAVTAAINIVATNIGVGKEINKIEKEKMDAAYVADPGKYASPVVAGGDTSNLLAVGKPPNVQYYPPKPPDYNNNDLRAAGKLTPSDKVSLISSATNKIRTYFDMIEKTIQAVQGMAKGAIELTKADLERLSGFLEAAKTQANQFLEMITKTHDSLGKDADEINSSMQKLVQMLDDIGRTLGQLGSSRA